MNLSNLLSLTNHFSYPGLISLEGKQKVTVNLCMVKKNAHELYIHISVAEVQEPEQGNTRTASKTPKRCSLCRHPMKGHSKVSTCPKNQKKQT